MTEYLIIHTDSGEVQGSVQIPLAEVDKMRGVLEPGGFELRRADEKAKTA